MKATKKSNAAVLWVLIMAAILATGMNAFAQGKPPDNSAPTTAQNVNVVNTPSVTIGNTPTVTVGSMPAVTLSGTPTVNIGTTASTVPVKSVENPARQPFSVHRDVTVPQNALANFEMVQIPVGKRLVIEQVSVRASVPSSTHEVAYAMVRSFYQIGNGLFDNNTYVPLTPVGHDGLNDNYVATQQTRVYADNNIGGLQLYLYRSADALNQFTGDVSGTVFISGYLVDLP
jgi:hypothetical protein